MTTNATVTAVKQVPFHNSVATYSLYIIRDDSGQEWRLPDDHVSTWPVPATVGIRGLLSAHQQHPAAYQRVTFVPVAEVA